MEKDRLEVNISVMVSKNKCQFQELEKKDERKGKDKPCGKGRLSCAHMPHGRL